jgi:polycomb protein EED
MNEPIRVRPANQPKRYRQKGYVKEEVGTRSSSDLNQGALYGVQFNPFLQKCGQYVFAAVGRNRASVYECESSGAIRLRQTYVDSEREENYYCCCWTYQVNSDEPNVASGPLLVVGGARGVIRVIDTTTREVFQELKGHGSSINDLKIHPNEPRLLMSASRDHSIRLWNIVTQTCVAILGGLEGHRDEVLSLDFHLTGSHLVSAGMDHALKIWSLKSTKLMSAVRESFTFNYRKSRLPFQTANEQFPVFTTRNVHRNYVDSVSWYGNCVLSKSCENAIVMWRPGKLETPMENDDQVVTNSNDHTASVLHKFECDDNEIWFIRFGLDEAQQVLAVGNQVGDIYLWNIDPNDPTVSR